MIVPRPRGGDWLEDEIKRLRIAGIEIVVSLLTSAEQREFGLEHESELCRAIDMDFWSLPIPDMGIPLDNAAALKIVRDIQDALDSGRSVAIHCRQSIGRSSIIAASVLVRYGVTPDRAFSLIAQARGYPVPETEQQREWVARFSQE